MGILDKIKQDKNLRNLIIIAGLLLILFNIQPNGITDTQAVSRQSASVCNSINIPFLFFDDEIELCLTQGCYLGFESFSGAIESVVCKDKFTSGQFTFNGFFNGIPNNPDEACSNSATPTGTTIFVLNEGVELYSCVAETKEDIEKLSDAEKGIGGLVKDIGGEFLEDTPTKQAFFIGLGVILLIGVLLLSVI